MRKWKAGKTKAVHASGINIGLRFAAAVNAGVNGVHNILWTEHSNYTLLRSIWEVSNPPWCFRLLTFCFMGNKNLMKKKAVLFGSTERSAVSADPLWFLGICFPWFRQTKTFACHQKPYLDRTSFPGVHLEKSNHKWTIQGKTGFKKF